VDWLNPQALDLRRRFTNPQFLDHFRFVEIQAGEAEIIHFVNADHLANAAMNRARKTKPNTGCFRKRFRSARSGRERLQALVFAKLPDVLDLVT